jgi:hypothetical protein
MTMPRRVDPLVVAEMSFGAIGRPATYQESHDFHELDSGLRALLAAAVMGSDDADQFAAFLARHHFLDWLHRHADQADRVIVLVDAGQYPSSLLPGPFSCLALANAAWLLGERALGEREVGFTRHRAVIAKSTKFWRDYGRAMQALVDRARFVPEPMKYVSLERYWAAYLQIVVDVTHDRDAMGSIAAAHESFIKRNRDKRLGPDYSGFDGTGLDPIAFDFRLGGILRYAGATIR